MECFRKLLNRNQHPPWETEGRILILFRHQFYSKVVPAVLAASRRMEWGRDGDKGTPLREAPRLFSPRQSYLKKSEPALAH